MPACAITDHGNMFGAVQFYQEATPRRASSRSSAARCTSRRRAAHEKAGRIDDYEAGGNYHLILLAMNREGYRNLCQLVTAGYSEGFYYKPRVDKELLRELNGGLIALSRLPARRGRAQPHDGPAARSARSRPRSWRASSTTASTSRSRTTTSRRRSACNGELIGARARRSASRCVATNDCHYLTPRGRARPRGAALHPDRQDVSDERRWKFETDQLYVKTPEEMAAAFAARARGDRATRVDDRRALRPRARRTTLAVPRLPGADRARRSRRRSSATARRGLDERLDARRTLGLGRSARRARSTGSASTSSSTSSSRWASPATSSSSRTSSTGRRRRASRSGPGAARRPAASSPTRCASPTSTRSRYNLLFERFLNPERAVDARHRRRLLLRPPRRGHPLRPREVRRGPRRRRSSPSGRSRGRRRSRTSAASSASPSPRPTGSPSSTPSRSRARTSRSRRRSRWSRGCASCATAGERERAALRAARSRLEGLHAPRLDARRRHRHRRQAALRVRAALRRQGRRGRHAVLARTTSRRSASSSSTSSA